MASKEPDPQSDPNYWSPEKCRELFGSFLSADSTQLDIPDWHIEILNERIRDYCENGVHMIPFEEVEKELLEEIKKDYREIGTRGLSFEEKELLEELVKG